MKKTILSLLACLASVVAFAQTPATAAPDVLVVKLVDGTSYRFSIPDASPSVLFNRGVARVSYYDSAKQESLFVDIERDNVDNIYFVNAEAEGVQAPEAQQADVMFRLQQAGVIAISGLHEGDAILVATADGRSVPGVTVSTGKSAVVDLTSQPRGIYLVSVNKRFTFKYMKS